MLARALTSCLRRWLAIAVLGSLAGCASSGAKQQPEARIAYDAGGQSSDASNGRDGSTSVEDARPAATDAAACERHLIVAEPTPPEVMVAVDQSTSMLLESRWSEAVDAISAVTRTLDANVAFGLSAFGTSSLVCGATRVLKAPATGNAEAIVDYLEAAKPLGDTPITAVLERISKLKKYGNAYSSSVYDGLPRIGGSSDDDIVPGSFRGISAVILVTDGAPNCNLDLDPQTCTCTHHDPAVCENNAKYNNPVACLDDVAAIEAVSSLRKLGIETYVIGYSTSRWAMTLNALAAAGTEGGLYIPVENALELENSLSEVAQGLQSCSFELEERPSDETYVRVTLSEDEILHRSQVEQGGWELDQNVVRLLGPDCDRARTDPSAVLEIRVECEKVFLR